MTMTKAYIKSQDAWRREAPRVNPTVNEPKFYVEVKTGETPFKSDKKKLSQVKNVVRGKFFREVQKQYVSCPVFKREISFVDCFNCQNFLRRMKGQVHCRGVEGVRDPALPLEMEDAIPELPSSESP